MAKIRKIQITGKLVSARNYYVPVHEYCVQVNLLINYACIIWNTGI